MHTLARVEHCSPVLSPRHRSIYSQSKFSINRYFCHGKNNADIFLNMKSTAALHNSVWNDHRPDDGINRFRSNSNFHNVNLYEIMAHNGPPQIGSNCRQSRGRLRSPIWRVGLNVMDRYNNSDMIIMSHAYNNSNLLIMSHTATQTWSSCRI